MACIHINRRYLKLTVVPGYLDVLVVADELNTIPANALVKCFIIFTEGAHITVVFNDICSHIVAEELSQLDRLHAAYPRAIVMGVAVTASHTVYDGNPFWYTAILQPDFAGCWSTRVNQSLELHPGQDVLIEAVAITGFNLWVEILKTGSQDDGSNLKLDNLVLLVEIYGPGGAELLTRPAFAAQKISAVIDVNHGNSGHCLGEGEVDCRTIA